ncbi:MAG TPA: cob(I)yrinic acid a,c-diamide adenosyltransferase [Armatimonadetes bacterium]|nr:cob(I)yrinic acid a,c-diamide adenosyltransferase [Armatimonadota bacterium]
MSIYTRAGDTGETTLANGIRVGKDSLRVHACGEVDELNSLLGVAAAFVKDDDVQQILMQVQHELFDVGADLAALPTDNSAEFHVTPHHVSTLEDWIDLFEAEVPAAVKFILPGGVKAAAFLHLARTVCRRAERVIVQLSRHEDINPQVLRYLNRLSDLLFVLARVVNHRASEPEKTWA